MVHPALRLVARFFTTLGVGNDIRKDLYARLQILPMSFHGRWRWSAPVARDDAHPPSGPVHVVRVVGVPDPQQPADHRDARSAAALLAPALGVVVLVSIVPIAATVLRFERGTRRLRSRRTRPRRSACRRGRWACRVIRIVRPRGLCVHDRFVPQIFKLNDTQVAGSTCRRSSGPCSVHPQLHDRLVLGWRVCRRDHGYVSAWARWSRFITMMLPSWPLVTGFLLSMARESSPDPTASPAVFDAQKSTAGPSNAVVAAKQLRGALRSGSRTVRTGAASCRHMVVDRANARADRASRLRQSRCGRVVLAARRHRGPDPHRRHRGHPRAEPAALRRTVATAFRGSTFILDVVAENLRLGRRTHRRRIGTGHRGAELSWLVLVLTL